MVIQIPTEEGSPRAIRYHVVKEDGEKIETADVEALTLYVFETETGTEKTPGNGDDLDVESCVFDTLQPWEIDNIGYNIRVIVSGDYITTGGKTYRIEVKVTPSEGEPFYLRPIELKAIEIYST